MEYKNLKKNHPKLFELLQREQERQRRTINLIASENYVSQAVLEALGTDLTNKYAEGQAGRRYYFGNKIVDEVEGKAKDLALKLFKLSPAKWAVNVQPYSGSPANLAIYLALLKPGDVVLAMDLVHGGHLTHGSTVSITGKLWKFVHYGVRSDGYIDYPEVERLAKKYKPQMIVCGATAYSRLIDFKKFSKIATRVGAYLVADISHIAGLIAGGAHPSPFLYADVVMTTTHKTLRGPRGAVIFSKKLKSKTSKYKINELIDRAVFPGLQGGPHMNQIYAIAVALEEALKPEFKKYIKQVIKNARALSEELQRFGFKVVSYGTDNHLFLVDLTSLGGMTGGVAGKLLEDAGIVVNKNTIPFEVRGPLDPSGIRLGVAAVTTRGMKEKEMKKIAGFIYDVLMRRIPLVVTRKKVLALSLSFKTTD